MKILLTICARGGSKGVKNKNIRMIKNKPLIAYTIEIAKKWNKASKIVCSTDSIKVAEIAQEFGAEVPFMRPNELAGDFVGKMSVIRHALRESERIYNEKYDLVVDLDVTSPIRTITDLDNCLALFNEKNPDIIFSVVSSKKNPYFNMIELKPDGFARLCKKLPKGVLRRQDAPKVFDSNASIYIYKRGFIMNENNNSPTKTDKAAIYVMGEMSSVDIDSEIDFKFVEFLIEQKVVDL